MYEFKFLLLICFLYNYIFKLQICYYKENKILDYKENTISKNKISYNKLLAHYTTKSNDNLCFGCIIVMTALLEEKTLSMKEVKILLRASDTKLHSIILKLDSKDFLKFSTDSNDNRKKLIQLSRIGREYAINLSFEDN